MRSNPLLVAGLGLVWLVGACNNTSTPSSSNNTPGTVIANPGLTYAPVIVEENAGGRSPDLRLVRTAYGRLVDVYGYDAQSRLVPVVTQVLVRASLVADLNNYLLETDRVTGQENLVIPRDVTSPTGRESFNQLLRAATEGLDAIFDTGFSQSGFYSMVPRNATLVLMFSDLLDPATINSDNVESFVGPAPFSTFAARVVGDPIHGDVMDYDGDGTQEFYTTRILVDFTTNSFESFQSSPPLPVNASGLPSAQDQTRDNVQVRIPTLVSSIFGQTTLLSNLSGHSLKVLANGSVDTLSPTKDIVRAFRSGGQTSVTGDLYNGFLRDEQAPNLIAALPALLTLAPVQTDVNDETRFNLPVLRFTSPDCAQKPQVGDVLFQTQVQGAIWARVTQVPLADPDGLGNVLDVKVQVLSYPPVWDDTLGVAQWTFEGIGALQFLSEYDPSTDAGRENCFLETFPLALDFPTNPAGRIPSTATWGLRFNEAMDSESFSAYDGLRLTRVNPALQTLTPSDYAITEISSSTDRTRFSLTPHFPLNHQVGQNESYFLSVTNTGLFAPTDLAGNKLRFPFAPIEGTLSENSVAARNGTHVSLFSSQDEEAPIADLSTDPFAFSEWGGQHVYLADRGVISPRPVSRFTQVVERSNRFTAPMGQFAGGVSAPLSRFGSLTQMLWRIYDLNMELFNVDLSDPATQDSPWNLDINKLNIDVERTYWSPVTGGITFDAFAGFSMRMSHAGFLPDELNSIPQNTVSFPGSGLIATFSGNLLSPTNDIPKEVHFREQGYTLNPGDKIQTSLPTILMPFPMNMSSTTAKRYYTYRDTALIERGGPNGVGANIGQYAALTGVTGGVFPFEAAGACDGTGGPTNFYFPGEVQTAALPLLIEFRCYPDSAATTANRLDVSDSQITTNPNPFFRAFSEGGINVEQDEIFVDPDSQVTASGGFDPASSPIPGAPTSGLDKEVYIGGIDFVVRVSRSFSVWIPTPDTLGNEIDIPLFYTPVVEPRAADQPPGTNIQFAYRGAGAIQGAFDGGPFNVNDGGFRMTAAAQTLDPYGDHYSNTLICALGPDSTPPVNPPQSNWPFKVVNHNSFDANLSAIGLLGAGGWFENAADINGAKFFQVRATFQSNAETGLAPVLSTFAMGWHQ